MVRPWQVRPWQVRERPAGCGKYSHVSLLNQSNCVSRLGGLGVLWVRGDAPACPPTPR